MYSISILYAYLYLDNHILCIHINVYECIMYYAVKCPCCVECIQYIRELSFYKLGVGFEEKSFTHSKDKRTPGTFTQKTHPICFPIHLFFYYFQTFTCMIYRNLPQEKPT